MGSASHNTIKVYAAVVLYTILLLMALVWAVIYHVLAPALTFVGGLVATTRLWQSLRSQVRIMGSFVAITSTIFLHMRPLERKRPFYMRTCGK